MARCFSQCTAYLDMTPLLAGLEACLVETDSLAAVMWDSELACEASGLFTLA
jgi:hypothetical protein